MARSKTRKGCPPPGVGPNGIFNRMAGKPRGRGGSELCGYLEHNCSRFGEQKVPRSEQEHSWWLQETAWRLGAGMQEGNAIREAGDGLRRGSCGGLCAAGTVSLLL